MRKELEGRRIVLGVSGGVAAYKAVELCRELVRRGAFVSPILTQSALRFIGEATFSAIASEPARTSLWDSPEPSPHTTLGQRADLVLVAPATANLVAAARSGTAHDLLTTTLLATRAPVLLCPAMHTEMWEHPAVVDNVRTLRERGMHVLEPADGELAGGDVGAGRLPETDTIVDQAVAVLAAARHSGIAPAGGDLTGQHVLVSAGGTREPIDPVRFIGNRSSGRQGHAIALAALDRGAHVTLVTTAGSDPAITDAGLTRIDVDTAQQLHDAMLQVAPSADVVVMCAAVADFRPAHVAAGKLKRREGLPSIELEPTPNVLRALVEARRPHQVIVGFAAETSDMLVHAGAKLRESGADLLVANDVSGDDAGFDHPRNAVTILSRVARDPIDVPLTSKRDVAERVLDAARDVQHAVGASASSDDGVDEDLALGSRDDAQRCRPG